MTRRVIDLAAHINQTVERGHRADFAVSLKPVCYDTGDGAIPIPKRVAVVREDTGEALAVVSTKYRLIPHQELLSVVQSATRTLDVGPVPRGVYVDRGGARMRALYKFPGLTSTITGMDGVCPCVKLTNTYDGTSRVGVQIGAFRFVCTNLAVGGGGAFAGGFLAVHTGEIPVGEITERLESYLTGFQKIVATYRAWADQDLDRHRFREILNTFPKRARDRIELETKRTGAYTVFHAYNAATAYATHEMRSVRTAFELLARINRGFQQQFSVN